MIGEQGLSTETDSLSRDEAFHPATMRFNQNFNRDPMAMLKHSALAVTTIMNPELHKPHIKEVVSILLPLSTKHFWSSRGKQCCSQIQYN